MRSIVFNDVPNKKYKEMINSVIGQLSDGIWENSPTLTGRWVFGKGSHDGTTIDVSTEYCDKYWNCHNPYIRMTDAQILTYFANKIKQIALIELEDMYYEENIKMMFGDDKFIYFYSEENDRKRKEYYEWKAANPFIKRGKFIPSDTKLCYLNYNEVITTSDAVDLYKKLTAKAKELRGKGESNYV